MNKISTSIRHTSVFKPEIKWEKPSSDFFSDKELTDKIQQPFLAAALTDSLSLAGYLSETSTISINREIFDRESTDLSTKSPSWAWTFGSDVPEKNTTTDRFPIPVIVVEFFPGSDEYSVKPTHPLGKWFYYERILQVPIYILFDPSRNELEVYRTAANGRYRTCVPSKNGLRWIPEAGLFVGVWEGTYQSVTGKWLRWWNADRKLLLWAMESVQQQKQKTRF